MDENNTLKEFASLFGVSDIDFTEKEQIQIEQSKKLSEIENFFRNLGKRQEKEQIPKHKPKIKQSDKPEIQPAKVSPKIEQPQKKGSLFDATNDPVTLTNIFRNDFNQIKHEKPTSQTPVKIAKKSIIDELIGNSPQPQNQNVEIVEEIVEEEPPQKSTEQHPPLTFRGNWNRKSTYHPGNIAFLDGLPWIVFRTNTNKPPDKNKTHWKPFYTIQKETTIKPVSVNSGGSGGELNEGLNIGSGSVEIFAGVSEIERINGQRPLEFKTLEAGNNITLNDSGDTVTISSTPGIQLEAGNNITLSEANDVITISSIQLQLEAGNNITLSEANNTVTISGTQPEFLAWKSIFAELNSVIAGSSQDNLFVVGGAGLRTEITSDISTGDTTQTVFDGINDATGANRGRGMIVQFEKSLSIKSWKTRLDYFGSININWAVYESESSTGPWSRISHEFTNPTMAGAAWLTSPEINLAVDPQKYYAFVAHWDGASNTAYFFDSAIYPEEQTFYNVIAGASGGSYPSGANITTVTGFGYSVKLVINIPGPEGESIDFLQVIADDLTPINFRSSGVSQWANDSGYITDLDDFSTSDLSEGSNLYYTDARVDSRLEDSFIYAFFQGG